jgi:hypothetical protein
MITSTVRIDILMRFLILAVKKIIGKRDPELQKDYDRVGFQIGKCLNKIQAISGQILQIINKTAPLKDEIDLEYENFNKVLTYVKIRSNDPIQPTLRFKTYTNDTRKILLMSHNNDNIPFYTSDYDVNTNKYITSKPYNEQHALFSNMASATWVPRNESKWKISFELKDESWQNPNIVIAQMGQELDRLKKIAIKKKDEENNAPADLKTKASNIRAQADNAVSIQQKKYQAAVANPTSLETEPKDSTHPYKNKKIIVKNNGVELKTDKCFKLFSNQRFCPKLTADDKPRDFTVDNNGAITSYEPKYENNYLYGPFTGIFPTKASNQDIALSTEKAIITERLKKGKSVCCIGYGASGAGKTSTLVYNAKTNEPGIISWYCKSIANKDKHGEQIKRQNPLDNKGEVFKEIEVSFIELMGDIDQENTSDPYRKKSKSTDPYASIIEIITKEADNDKDLVALDSPLDVKPTTNPRDRVARAYNKRTFVMRPTLNEKGKEELTKDWYLNIPDDKSIIIEVPDQVDSNKNRSTIRFTSKTTIGDYVVNLMDNVRNVNPTTNNEESSRSHLLILLKLKRQNGTMVTPKGNPEDTVDPYFIICDFAGVENRFSCDNESIVKSFEELFNLKFKKEAAETKKQKDDEIQKIIDDSDKANNDTMGSFNNNVSGSINTKYQNKKKEIQDSEKTIKSLNDTYKGIFNLKSEEIKNLMTFAKNIEGLKNNLTKTILYSEFNKGAINEYKQPDKEHRFKKNKAIIAINKYFSLNYSEPTPYMASDAIIELQKIQKLFIEKNISKELETILSYKIRDLPQELRNLEQWKLEAIQANEQGRDSTRQQLDDKKETDLQILKNKHAEDTETRFRKYCNKRVTEGIVINHSLKELRKFISYFVKYVQSADSPLIVPPYSNYCAVQQCNPYLEDCLGSLNDAGELEPKQYGILANKMLEALCTDDPTKRCAEFDQMTFCIFNVINLSQEANNPSPSPYIDITDLVTEYNTIKSIDYLDVDFDKSSKMVDVSRINMEPYQIPENILSRYDYTKYDIDQKLVDPLLMLLSKADQEEIYKDVDNLRKVTTNDQTLFNLTNLLNTMRNINAITTLGTLEFIDQMAKFGLNETACNYKIKYQLNPTTFSTTNTEIKDIAKESNTIAVAVGLPQLEDEIIDPNAEDNGNNRKSSIEKIKKFIERTQKELSAYNLMIKKIIGTYSTSITRDFAVPK